MNELDLASASIDQHWLIMTAVHEDKKRSSFLSPKEQSAERTLETM
jgi:hypothetical protein